MSGDIQQKVKDNVLRVQSVVGKWKLLNIEGLSHVSEISNKLIERSENSESAAAAPDIEQLCEKLGVVLCQMEKIVAKLNEKLVSFEGLKNLAASRQNQIPVAFGTWTLEMFETSMEDLVDAYRKELLLKRRILDQMSVCGDRSMQVFYTAAWQHQPHMTPDCDMIMNSMVQATEC